MKKTIGWCLGLALLPAALYAVDQHERTPLVEPCIVPQAVADELDQLVDRPTASLVNPRATSRLLTDLFAGPPECITKVVAGGDSSSGEKACAAAPNLQDPKFYAIVHVLRWDSDQATSPTGGSQQQGDQQGSQQGDQQGSPSGVADGAGAVGDTGIPIGQPNDLPAQGSGAGQATAAPAAPTVAKENWYVYHLGGWTQEDFATRKHLPGVDHVWLVYLHLDGTPGRGGRASYRASYDVAVTRKTPLPLQNLLALGQLAGNIRAQNARADYWGTACIPLDVRPADFTVAGAFTTDGRTTAPLGEPVTFDDEGPYRWDVSVGVPVRKVSELEFGSNGSTVTKKEIEGQTLFGLFEFHPVPVDLVRRAYSRWPHFVLGVGLKGDPKDRLLGGLGWDTRYVSFFAAGVRVEQELPATLGEGDQATPEQVQMDLRREHDWKFVVGLTLPVRKVIDLISQANQ